MTHSIKTILDSFSGTTFGGIDITTSVTLSKKMETVIRNLPGNGLRVIANSLFDSGVTENPMYGKIIKKTSGIAVTLFSNKNQNGYENMVKRRLAEEGKDPESFQLSKAKWGTRLEDSPIIEHNGEYYLEVIVRHHGTPKYFYIHNEMENEISKDMIFGFPPSREKTGQGGLENQVVVNRYKLSSITGIRVLGDSYTGDFVY